MKSNWKFPYQKELKEIETHSKVYIGGILISIILLIFTRLLFFLGFIGLFGLLEYFNVNTVHGFIELVINNKQLQILTNDKSQNKRLIKSHYFSWHYKHFEYAMGNTGRKETTHSNFIQLKLEMTDHQGHTIAIIQELSPWQSLPSNWEYKLLEEEYDENYRIKKGLIELKKEIGLLL